MADDQLLCRPVHPCVTETPGAEQSRRRAAVSASVRLLRQIQSTDASIAARREQEQSLNAPGISRDQRLVAKREIEVLRRTRDAIKGRCARGLADAVFLRRHPPGDIADILVATQLVAAAELDRG